MFAVFPCFTFSRLQLDRVLQDSQGLRCESPGSNGPGVHWRKDMSPKHTTSGINVNERFLRRSHGLHGLHSNSQWHVILISGKTHPPSNLRGRGPSCASIREVLWSSDWKAHLQTQDLRT